tara:strand:+ start:146 stop:403 length:258 start_codon:yes stop_codon:yes gene_type:complete
MESLTGGNGNLKEELAKNLAGLQLKDLDAVECENCGNPTFQQVTLLRKISPVMNPTGKAGFLPIPIYQCAKCGHINEELMPKTDV